MGCRGQSGKTSQISGDLSSLEDIERVKCEDPPEDAAHDIAEVSQVHIRGASLTSVLEIFEVCERTVRVKVQCINM